MLLQWDLLRKAEWDTGEEGTASLLRGQRDPGFCLPPNSELAYCKWGFPGFCLGLTAIVPKEKNEGRDNFPDAADDTGAPLRCSF